MAETSAQKESLWKMRRNIGLAVKSYSVYKEEDTVVPRNNLPDLIEGVKLIGNKYKFKSICYGHAGDGNLHINILRENISDLEWDLILKKLLGKYLHYVLNLVELFQENMALDLFKKIIWTYHFQVKS